MEELRKGSDIPGWLMLLVPLSIITLLIIFEGPPWMKLSSADSSRSEALNLIDAGKQMLKEGNKAEAFLQINAAVKMCPDFPEAHLAMGLLLNSTNHKREAIQSFEKAIALDPKKKDVLYNNIGLVYYDLGEYEKAREMFYKSAARGLRQTKIWRNVAMVEERLANKDAVIKAYRKVIDERGTISNLYANMLKESRDEDVYAWCADTIKFQLAKGFSEQDLDKFDRKIVDFYLNRDPGLTSDYLNLALTYESMGSYEYAAYYFERYLNRRPEDTATINRLGVALARLKRYPEAERAFLQTLKRDPNNVGAKKALAMLRGTAESPATPQIEDR